jgi:cytochrome c oxidase subunit 2
MSAPAAPDRPAALVNAVARVDETFLLIFGVSAVILALITAAMVYFVIRYNRRRHPVAADFSHNTVAEVVWTVVPTLLVMGMFWSGWSSYQIGRAHV